jgi:2-dehydropantoate 2-reductase
MSGPILIWGAGAIGGTVGAYFRRAGLDVHFVDIVPDHVERIRAGALRIEGPVDNLTVGAPADTPDTLKGRFVETYLCVKAHHTDGAARQLLPHLADDGFVVSLQNGLNELAIAEIVGRPRTVGAFVNFGADYLEPGVVHYAGRGAVVVGELDGARTPRIEAIHRRLLTFDRDAVLTDNIWGYLWGKLGYGAQLFATALTNASIADALASERHYTLFRAIGREAVAAATARGVKCEGFNGFDPAAFMPDAPEEATRRSFAAMVAHNHASAKSHSGIWRDLAVRKRKTEVDAQIAIIPKLAAETAVSTPVIARLVELIHDVEAGRRPQDWATLDELGKVL